MIREIMYGPLVKRLPTSFVLSKNRSLRILPGSSCLTVEGCVPLVTHEDDHFAITMCKHKYFHHQLVLATKCVFPTINSTVCYVMGVITVDVGDPVRIKRGDDTTLYCQYWGIQVDQAEIEWHFRSSSSVTAPRQQIFQYRADGNIEHAYGNFDGRVTRGDRASLQIRNITDTDDGVYECEVGAVGHQSATKSIPLTVLEQLKECADGDPEEEEDCSGASREEQLKECAGGDPEGYQNCSGASRGVQLKECAGRGSGGV
uniref:Ig-like domain-containing protein n=1 Tax=Branchiostoma floridae TaxID=7739 RepID=C3YP79_BRAFL|eukprot:XP_002601958.1 hypothetical protein BRAFLDRAFT_86442 [Branchiostoma floridae]